MKPRFALDAWAILAFLQGEEPAAARVKQLLEDAEQGHVELFVSIINLGEVVYRIGKIRGEDEDLDTLAAIHHLPATVVSATDEAVLAAARLKMRHAISYADAFALAVAVDHASILITGDPELTALGRQFQIEILARSGSS